MCSKQTDLKDENVKIGVQQSTFCYYLNYCKNNQICQGKQKGI